MNMMKGLLSLAATGAAVAGACYLVLKKQQESEENVIYSSKKEFNEENTDISVSENEDEQVEVAFIDETGNGDIKVVQDANGEGIIDSVYQTEVKEEPNTDEAE